MEYRRNSGNNSGGILAGIPVEYQQNAGNNSGGIPAGIPVEYRRNAGNNSVEFRLEFHLNTGGMPAIVRRNSGWKCPEFRGNTGGMPAIIPAEFQRNPPGIYLEFGESPDWNSGGIPPEFQVCFY